MPFVESRASYRQYRTEADATTVARGRALGIDAESALARFDAYPLFTALGDTLVTGPTHNNLRDLRIMLSA